jgi:hypothetical protein
MIIMFIFLSIGILGAGLSQSTPPKDMTCIEYNKVYEQNNKIYSCEEWEKFYKRKNSR